MFKVVVIISILLSGLNIYAITIQKEDTDTIAYTNTAKPQFFYKSRAVTDKELVKMLDVNAFKKAGLSLRKAKRRYFINKGLSYLAGALISYPFFAALFNKDLYAGPCIMAAGTVLINLNISKSYNNLLLSIVREHNQKLIAADKKNKHHTEQEPDQVL